LGKRERIIWRFIPCEGRVGVWEFIQAMKPASSQQGYNYFLCAALVTVTMVQVWVSNVWEEVTWAKDMPSKSEAIKRLI